MESKGRQKIGLFSATVFAVGYSIGTAYLVSPATAGITGFWLPVLVGFLTCIFFFCTSLLFVEALLLCPQGSSVVTLCRKLVGKAGLILASISFLMVQYYFLGETLQMLGNVLNELFLKNQLNNPVLFSLILFAYSVIVYVGNYFCNRVNLVLCVGLFVTAIVAIASSFGYISLDNVEAKQGYLIFVSVPVIMTVYDFHGFLPSLTKQLRKNPRKIFFAVLYTLAFLFFFYSLWLFILMNLSTTQQLWDAFETGWLPLHALEIFKKNPFFVRFFNLSLLFTTSTSVIGLGVVLVDFFEDAYPSSFKKIKLKRFIFCLVAFFPVLAIVLGYPDIYKAYFPSYIVGFAEVFFICILPIWLIFKARFVLKLQTVRFFPGGKIGLSVLTVITFVYIYLEAIQFFRFA